MNIEDLAREAAETCGKRAEYNCDRAWLARFAALVRAAALDEAAAVCKERAAVCAVSPYEVFTAEYCAHAINALKDKP
jgi:hypothetical protein